MHYILAILLIAICILDWKQTLMIARNPDRFVELNPILGAHPTEDQVALYFTWVILLIVLLAALVPPQLLYYIFGICILVESWVVWRNRKIGL